MVVCKVSGWLDENSKRTTCSSYADFSSSPKTATRKQWGFHPNQPQENNGGSTENQQQETNGGSTENQQQENNGGSTEISNKKPTVVPPKSATRETTECHQYFPAAVRSEPSSQQTFLPTVTPHGARRHEARLRGYQ